MQRHRRINRRGLFAGVQRTNRYQCINKYNGQYQCDNVNACFQVEHIKQRKLYGEECPDDK